MATADLPAEFYVALVRVTRALRRETPGTLSAGSLSALFALSRSGPLRPTALAEAEGVAAASMTRILQAMEGEGLLRRTPDPSDGRAHLITLTDAGEALVRRGTETRVEAVRRRIASLSDAERSALTAAIPVLARLSEL